MKRGFSFTFNIAFYYRFRLILLWGTILSFLFLFDFSFGSLDVDRSWQLTLRVFGIQTDNIYLQIIFAFMALTSEVKTKVELSWPWSKQMADGCSIAIFWVFSKGNEPHLQVLKPVLATDSYCFIPFLGQNNHRITVVSVAARQMKK